MPDSSIYISDMGLCIPKTCLSKKPKKGRWILIEYEAEDVKGVMMFANPKTGAPNVIYPAKLRGWHAIYLGLWDWAWSAIPAMSSGIEEHMLKIRLKDDPCFTQIMKENLDYRIEEFFWKYADLTGQHFVIGQQSEGYSKRACLAYIKVVPLSDEEVEGVKKDRGRKDTKRLIAMNDADSWMYDTHPTSREEIYSQVEPYRDTDFGKLFYEYRPAGAKGYTVEYDDFPRIGDEYASDSRRIFKDMDIEPFEEVVRYGHKIGLEIYASYRLGIGSNPPPFFAQRHGKFYLSHPEFRCVDRDGSILPCLSYAFPKVRTHVIQVVQRAIELGGDGVNPLFHRGPPFVLYEDPLVRGFTERYGEDPRRLPDTNERWLRFRASALTEFMREQRRKVNETARKVGRPDPGVSCVVFPNRALNLRYGLEPEVWVKEGLTDLILARDMLYAPFEKTPVDIEYFLNLVKGSGCKFYVMLGNRMAGYTIEKYFKKTLGLFEAGVDGIAFWDTNAQFSFTIQRYTAQWTAVRRLGHIEEVRDIMHGRKPLITTKVLKKLGGIDVTFQHDPWYFV